MLFYVNTVLIYMLIVLLIVSITECQLRVAVSYREQTKQEFREAFSSLKSKMKKF